MPTTRRVGTRVRYSIERFDGGLNTNDSPSKVSPFDSPDCLNVVFDTEGAIVTRNGTNSFNTQTIGTFAVDGQISFNQTMFAWAGGSMYRMSGTTAVTIPSAQNKYTAGNKVAAVIYQGLLFSSDGANGPWKYDGSNFYNMGIVSPSATTGSGTSAGSIATGTYFYKVSNVNSQAVEGQCGSVSAGVTLATTSTIGLTQVPVGSSLAGVDKRRLYRATSTSGPFRRVGEISDNTTTTFADTTANEQEGVDELEDGNPPTTFNTIHLHQERLFFDDASNKSLLRYTNYTNPFISNVENFEPINNRDGEDILAISDQDNFVTIFKNNNNFAIQTTDPSDDLTWIKYMSPSNLGIVGPRAFAKVQNGIAFIGRQNNRITGLHLLTGIQVIETSDGRLRTETISRKIEPTILTGMDSSFWQNIAITTYQNRLYITFTPTGQTKNKKILWFDLNRIGDKGQPGSWSLWDGIELNTFAVHNGLLYGGGSAATGQLYQLETSTYNDSGVAINSYFWTKEIGGEDEGELDSYIKDFRQVYIWHGRVGNYNMNVRYRLDGDTGNGLAATINLNATTSNWGTMIWGVNSWGGTRSDFENRIPLSRLLGKRIQFRFDNQNAVNQSFKVHRLELDMNLRRKRQ